MYKRTLILLPVFLVVSLFLASCGYKNVVPIKEVPKLTSYSKIVLVFFNKKDSQKYQDLPILTSYTTGTNLSVKCKEKEWLYDQSKRVCPVNDELKELGINPYDICQSHSLATKLSESTGVELVVIGQMEEPKFTEDRSGKIEYDMSTVDVTGAARYYAIYQTAILKTDFELIDAKSGQLIWDGRVIGYKKYKTRYRTGSPPAFQREETMLNDVRMDLIKRFVDIIYPAIIGQEVS